MNTPTYIVFGILVVGAGVWLKSADPEKTPRVNSMIHGTEQSLPAETMTSDEGLGWTCTRSNANGAGTVPCQLIVEPNRVTYSFVDSAQVTFHVQNADASGVQEVSGVQVEGGNREAAFGFCEQRGDALRCEASNGETMVEYEAH